MMKQLATGALIAVGLSLPQVTLAQSETVQQIQDRGTMLCSGHNGSYFGFVEVND